MEEATAMNGGISKLLSPRLLGRLKSLLRRGNHYTGNHADWASASAASSGYDAGDILAKVRDAVRKVRDGEAVCERDSVLFAEPQYPFPVLAGLLLAARASGGRLSVLDFGGSLGSTYFQCRQFLSGIPEMRWSVVEQEGFVRCGREEFEDGALRFHPSIAASCAASEPDVVLLSGVLQYVPDPYGVLEQIAAAQIPHIVVDRLATSALDGDRIAVQHVPASIYKASYPIRIFGRHSIVKALAGRYRVVADFESTWDGSHPEYCEGLEFCGRGLILENSAVATAGR
jgi:putative methyltransferase (TIGR04325 family)